MQTKKTPSCFLTIITCYRSFRAQCCWARGSWSSTGAMDAVRLLRSNERKIPGMSQQRQCRWWRRPFLQQTDWSDDDQPEQKWPAVHAAGLITIYNNVLRSSQQLRVCIWEVWPTPETLAHTPKATQTQIAKEGESRNNLTWRKKEETDEETNE